MDIPHEKKFHFADGTAVGTTDELGAKLEGISYQEFYGHVNAEKNDFANWVRHVHNNPRLAEDLEKVTSIVETIEILNDSVHPPAHHDDIQSKIEEELHVHVQDVPETPAEGGTPAEVAVEEVPSTAPVEAEHTDEPADLEVIAEAEEEHHPPPEHEAPVHETPHVEQKPEAASSENHVLTQHDYTRLIVKDFMYGLVFGLIIGLILGRILTF